MAKHRGSRRHRSRSRSYKGGNANYTSASTYGSYVNGSGDSQFARTFDTTGEYAGRAGSEYVGAQGQWSHQPGSPNAQNLALIQSAATGRSILMYLGDLKSPMCVEVKEVDAEDFGAK